MSGVIGGVLLIAFAFGLGLVLNKIEFGEAYEKRSK